MLRRMPNKLGQVEALLRVRGPQTKRAIARELDISEGYAWTLLNTLKARGAADNPRRGLWVLTPAAVAYLPRTAEIAGAPAPLRARLEGTMYALLDEAPDDDTLDAWLQGAAWHLERAIERIDRIGKEGSAA